MPITVPFGVLARGYVITGDVRSGYKATVPYLVSWSDAFTFADEMLGKTTATAVGPITWVTPYLFPGSSSARLYAQRFTMEPCGADGSLPIPTQGLKPGEFFTHAKVVVEFETPQMVYGPGDDPSSQNQLDPSNPITMCRQRVRSGGKMETRKNGSYVYDSTSKPVPGDFAAPTSETKLELTFPRVPYLPWQLVRPYINTINSASILGVGEGELLLESMDTDVTPGPDGSLQEQLVLFFAVTPVPGVTWNHLPKPDGTLDLVRVAADIGSGSPRRIYAGSDFTEIFSKINYV